jgi:serine protease Do/serine protease DegQ
MEATSEVLRSALWTILVLGFGVIIGLGVMLVAGRNVPGSAPPATSSAAAPGLFAPVVERIIPAVVSIDVEKRFRHSDLGFDDEGLGEGDPGFGDREFEIPSSGSGFLIDSEGHIVTNDHVVRDGIRIDVHLSDGRVLPARLVGRDPMTDIAVVQIDSDHPLPTVPLGDSDDVRIGDWVVAIGNPLGMLEGSVTAGIVSAKGRTDISIRGGAPSYQDFIQTDASINPGNSGGPLVDDHGRAIGVNTAYNAPGNGIGFAISINMAREVTEQLIRKGRVPRAMFGVGLTSLDADLARGWGLEGVSGVLVTEVQQGSPADLSGIEEGDIIIEFDGQPTPEVSPFRLLVARSEVGRKVLVKYLRHGRSEQVIVHLVERSDPVPVLPTRRNRPEGDLLGLFLSRSGVGGGVLVDSVMIDSPAFRAGIRDGDILLDVGWREVATPESFRRELRNSLRDNGVAVLKVRREGSSAFLSLRPD